MRHALFWYRVLVVGGFLLLIRSVGWLGYEVRCIVAKRETHRLFPFTRPAIAISALIGTACFGVVLYLLNITLVLPALMLMAHLGSKTIGILTVRRPRPGRAERSGAPAVERNWHYYDGVLYETAIEPLAREMRHATAAHVLEGSCALDLCCGTGGLVFHLAGKCASVTGIDHALGMVHYARQRQLERGIKNVSFAHADARFLSDFADEAFDYAVLSMALHEMPRAASIQVLKEAARVAREIILVDYTVPLPTHTQGLVFRYLEVIAGRSHLQGFLNYSRHRGLDSLVEEADLAIKSDATITSQCIRIVKAVRNETGRHRSPEGGIH